MSEKYIIPPGNFEYEHHKVFYDEDDENNLLSVSYAQLDSLKALATKLERAVSSLIIEVDFDYNEAKICEATNLLSMLREELNACNTYKYYKQYLTLPNDIIPFTHAEANKILSDIPDGGKESVELIKRRIKTFS